METIANMETDAQRQSLSLAKIVAATLPNGKILAQDGPRPLASSLFASDEKATFAYGTNGAALGPITLYSLKSTSLAALSDAVRIFSGPTSLLLESAESTERHHRGDHDETSMLVFPYLSDEKQDFLRDRKIAFADEAGNAWMEFDNLVIDRRGYKPLKKMNVTTALYAPSLSFPDSVSLVIRILLDHEGVGVRDIASLAADQSCSISIGQVSKVVSRLNSAGYIERNRNAIRLRRKRELLDEWTTAYKRIHSRDSVCFYLFGREIKDVRNTCGEIVGEHGILTGSAGASLVDYHAEFTTVTILSANMKTVVTALEHAGATRTERGWNVCVVSPRYSESAFWGSRLIDNQSNGVINVASDLQLYLDLTREQQRGSEAAAHLYDRFLRKMFESAATGDRS